MALNKSQFGQLLETVSELGSTPHEGQTEEISSSSTATADRDSESTSEGTEVENLAIEINKVDIGTTLEATVRAHFAIAEFLVEFCEEDSKPFARMNFHEFDFEMVRHSRQTQMIVSIFLPVSRF